MANTYTQLYTHFVFAVQNRLSLIASPWETELHKYIGGIVRNRKHKLIAINGMPDHIHLFIGLHPTEAPSTIAQIVKGESSEWINKKRFVTGRFQWQQGFAAFSHGRHEIPTIYKYITNQKEHHKNVRFIDEYIQFLKEHEISFDARYVFQEIE